MSWIGRFGRTQSSQQAFLILLIVCAAQLAYWLIDETRYTARVNDRIEAGYRREAEAAKAMLQTGAPRGLVEEMHPDVTISPDGRLVTVSDEALRAIRDERFHRLHRYAWEGAFFLLVLLGAIAVVYRTLREERALRRRQDNFMAAVSHELKTPLASLRLSADTLALRDPGPERRAALIERIRDDLQRLQRMIANILDASRLAQGPAPAASRERLALADELRAVLEELQSHVSHHGTRIHVDVPADVAISATPECARTVLRNVLDNAIKATAGGGDVTVRAEQRDGRVQCIVRDTGTGFPPQEGDRLFEKFYRVEQDTRPRGAGTGLGLYLAWQCARRDHGSIAAASGGPGTGATFTITWLAPHA